MKWTLLSRLIAGVSLTELKDIQMVGKMLFLGESVCFQKQLEFESVDWVQRVPSATLQTSSNPLTPGQNSWGRPNMDLLLPSDIHGLASQATRFEVKLYTGFPWCLTCRWQNVGISFHDQVSQSCIIHLFLTIYLSIHPSIYHLSTHPRIHPSYWFCLWRTLIHHVCIQPFNPFSSTYIQLSFTGLKLLLNF